MANPHIFEGSRIPHLTQQLSWSGSNCSSNSLLETDILLPQERLRFRVTCCIKLLFLPHISFLFRYAAQFNGRARKQSTGFTYPANLIYCSSARPRKLTATKFNTRGEKGQQKLHIFGSRILHLAFVSARWFILSNQAEDGVVKDGWHT